MSDKQLTARRQTAMQALEMDAEASYPFLRQLISDTDETVRLNAVLVLGFLGTRESRALLRHAAADASSAVQKAALDALRGSGFVPNPSH